MTWALSPERPSAFTREAIGHTYLSLICSGTFQVSPILSSSSTHVVCIAVGMYMVQVHSKFLTTVNPSCGVPLSIPRNATSLAWYTDTREVRLKTRPFIYIDTSNSQGMARDEGQTQAQGQGHRPRFDSMRSQSSIGQGWARPASPTVRRIFQVSK